MAIYMDFSGTEGAIGYISDGEPVVPVGVSIHAMPLSIQKKEWELYQKFAEDNDVHFLFADHIPTVDFYAVPCADIAATDSCGGLIASVGAQFSLSDKIPLIYITPDKACFLITEDGSQFLSIASEWKNHLKPCDGVKIYPSKEATMADYPITNVVDTPEYKKFVQMSK